MLEIDARVSEILRPACGQLSDELLASDQPVIIRALVADWPATSACQQSPKQALDYLQRFDAGHQLTACLGGAECDGRVFYNSDMSGFNFRSERMPLAHALRQLAVNAALEKPPLMYIASTNIDRWLPGFRDHNEIAGLAAKQPLASIWLGNRSRIAAHYDFPSNIACCVAGRRRFILFPPEQLPNLYVGPLDFTPAGQPISLVDFKNPDYLRFPKFRTALKSAQLAELEPGDALLIPSMWWHHVEALDSFNVLVNYWWRNSPTFMGAPLGALQHALLALRNLPPEQRKVWRGIFDHYIFDPPAAQLDHIPESARGVLNPIDSDAAAAIRASLLRSLQ